MKRTSSIRAQVALGAALILAASAQAGVTYSFQRITSNAPLSQNVASQLSMTVSDTGDGLVSLVFRNFVGAASSVKNIYFDFRDSALPLVELTLPAPAFALTSGGSTARFAGGVSNATLPGGNSAPLLFHTDYAASALGAPAQRGLNESADSLAISFALAPGRSYGDVLGALNSGALRVGMHVIAIGAYSDSFVNSPIVPAIPAPAAALLGLVGLALTGIRRSAN